jgi:hypothetical protein
MLYAAKQGPSRVASPRPQRAIAEALVGTEAGGLHARQVGLPSGPEATDHVSNRVPTVQI